MFHSADLTGALNFLSPPFFDTLNTLPISGLFPNLTSMSPELEDFIGTLSISNALEASLLELRRLSQNVAELMYSNVVTGIPEQVSMLKRTYALRYEFLSHLFDIPNILDEFVPMRNDKLLEDVLRAGALLYMQTTLQEFPLAAIGSLNLVQRLKTLVMGVRINNSKEGRLVVWLLVVGGLEAKNEDRAWFVIQLEKLLSRLKIATWEEVKKALEGLWWIGKVHDDRGRRLWEEVETSRSSLLTKF
jgi:hypothetical protein